MANEASVLQKVKHLLQHHSKCIGLRVTSTTGMPDLIACVNGRFVGIEVKDDKNGPYQLTKAQIMRLNKIASCGGVACCVDKYNFTSFARTIDTLVENPNMAVSHWGYSPD
jgi:Holliday junction resolvase